MIRAATNHDLDALFRLERAASLAALGHIFGPLPYPDGDVLARWQIVLSDPETTVLIDTADSGDEPAVPIGFAAYDRQSLRHLGYDPSWWGTGRANVLHDVVVSALRDAGTSEAYLWVLVDNFRARRFYQRAGWVDTGVTGTAEFPPYPDEMQLSLTIGREPTWTSH